MNRKAYGQELFLLIESLPADKRQAFVQTFLEREKNPVVAFGFSVWLGGLGIDRFYAGQVGLGVVKLITLGGLGIWSFIDLFLIGGVIRDKNLAAAREVKASLS